MFARFITPLRSRVLASSSSAVAAAATTTTHQWGVSSSSSSSFGVVVFPDHYYFRNKTTQTYAPTNTNEKADRAVFLSLLEKTASRKLPDEALHILSMMEAKKVVPDTACYNAALAACESSRPEEVASVMKKFEQDGNSPNLVTLSIAARAFERMEKYSEALGMHVAIQELLRTQYKKKPKYHVSKTHRQLREYGCKPLAITYSVLIMNQLENNNVHEAYSLFLDLVDDGTKVPFSTLDLVLTACVRENKTKEALHIQEMMSDLKLLTINEDDDEFISAEEEAELEDACGSFRDRDSYYNLVAKDAPVFSKDWKLEKKETQ